MSGSTQPILTAKPMRIAVAGSTGVLGRSTCAGPPRRRATRSCGMSPVPSAGEGDDRDRPPRPRRAPRASPPTGEPEAIVHLATAIPDDIDPRRAVEQFEPTNRLRTEGTANLRAAAEAAGGARLISAERRLHGRPARARDRGRSAPGRARRRDGAHRRCHSVALERTTLDGRRHRAQVRPLLRPRDRPTPPTARSADGRGSGGCRSCTRSGEPGRASPSSTSTTRRGRSSRRSTAARRASSTSSTTSPRRSRSGCPRLAGALGAQAADAAPGLACAADDRGLRGRVHVRPARSLERPGEGRARLEPSSPREARAADRASATPLATIIDPGD